MKSAAIVALILVILLVAISSYLRLDHSGVGCEPWPACYGNIGQPAQDAGIQSAYDRLVKEAREPMSWARPLHRLVASLLGLLVLGLVVASQFRRRHRLLAISLLAVTVFLAWLGVYSEGLHSPAIVMGNLGGGFLMLGLFGWLVFRLKPQCLDARISDLPMLTNVAIVVLSSQILLGGLTSANFAATACTTLPRCQGELLPQAKIWAAFDLTRSIPIDAEGFAVGGAERPAIHQFHRLAAILTCLAVLGVAVRSWHASDELRPAAMLIGALVVAELTVGVTAVLTDIPIGVAVAHNWLAALLLLGLIYMRARLP